MKVDGLLHFGLQVPDLAVGAAFFKDFGLDISEQPAVLTVRCAGREQDQTVLVEGADKRLDHVAFAISPGTGQRWQQHLEGQGVRIEDAAADAPDGIWFRDPDHNKVVLQERALAPARAADPPLLNLAGDYRRIDDAAWLHASAAVAPRRLGHMLIFASDAAASERFYLQALGLAVSDRIPGKVSFLNAGPGDHHVFGLIQSSHAGLHHSSWEVGGIDEIGFGAKTMAEQGHTLGWGLGRHSLGSNLFHYIQDPWGSWIEYFTDIDQITEAWEPREWDTPPAVWCPLMPTDFLTNVEPKPE